MSAMTAPAAPPRPGSLLAMAGSRWTALVLAVALAGVYLALRHMQGPAHLAAFLFRTFGCC